MCQSEHEDLNLLICMTLGGFLGQVNSKPFSEFAPGGLREAVIVTFRGNAVSGVVHFQSAAACVVRREVSRVPAHGKVTAFGGSPFHV